LSYAISGIGIVAALSALGVSWDKLQWLVAALSVGLGFGLQEIFANFISGLIILFERPVRIGDVVTIGNLSGTVSKI
ncbi:mechanosensitive ion channel, partial [Klebsiella pneumoniae]|nr:mechanosensitive ion channel [Klebsiella pneumoniae]